MIDLDEGEAEVIVLAIEKSVDLILLDDYEARQFARRYGLKITGTIGILLRAKYDGKIKNLKVEMDKLIKSGFWIGVDLYNKILEDVGEL